jgi:hypothetical protein
MFSRKSAESAAGASSIKAVNFEVCGKTVFQSKDQVQLP